MMADHKKVKKQINIVKGQLDGIIKMIDEDSYCIDISNQLLASIAILKKTNTYIINEHLNTCIRNAKNEDDLNIKIEEISKILDRISK